MGKIGSRLIAKILSVAFYYVETQFLPLPEVPYRFEELEPDFNGMDVRRHYHEIFGHHVDRFNSALKQLRYTAAYRKILKHGGIDGLLRHMGDVPVALQRKLRYHAGGYVNHELFFRMLRPRGADASMPEGGNAPEAGCPVFAAIEQSFTSFNAFRKEFGDMARGLHGVGWIWLVVETALERVGESALPLKIIETIANDHPLMATPTVVPLLCLDVWEHAYFGQFYNNRQRYIEAWWNLVNWEEVNRVFSNVDMESRISGTTSPSLDFTFDASNFVPVPVQDISGYDFVPLGNFVAADLAATSGPSWKLTSEAVEDGGCWSSLMDLLARMQPSRQLSVQPHCSSSWRSSSSSDIYNRLGTSSAAAVVANKAIAKDEIIMVWPLNYTLSSRGFLKEDDVRDGTLGDLVAALIMENRRTDSPWHAYLEYLHGHFDELRRSALFWPKLLLNALNATAGLDTLRLAAGANMYAAKLFRMSPDLLDPSASVHASSKSDRSQSLFDAEIHWAVSCALCRGIQRPTAAHGIDEWSLLPGSELFMRADARRANAQLRPSSSSAWEMVAKANIQPGEGIVLEERISNVERLACAWPELQGNSHGPRLSLPTFDSAVVEHTAKLSREAQRHGERTARMGKKWLEQNCTEQLREPRVDRLEDTGFLRSLVLCIAYGVRLLEAHQAGASKTVESPSSSNLTMSNVLYHAYALVGQACDELGKQHRAAKAELAQRDGATASWELETAARLERAIDEDITLLERCAKHAVKQSMKSLAKARAGNRAFASQAHADTISGR